MAEFTCLLSLSNLFPLVNNDALLISNLFGMIVVTAEVGVINIHIYRAGCPPKLGRRIYAICDEYGQRRMGLNARDIQRLSKGTHLSALSIRIQSIAKQL